jgi:23S rRNA (uracil1939-C5)-methyltransferase
MPETPRTEPSPIQGLKRGDLITVRTESLSGEGTSVGRWEGIACFVEHAVPGDTARVRLFKIKKQFLAGRAVEILEPSPLRTEPRCAHFGVCGGCRWQNLSYESQLEFKRRRVKDAFTHIGGFPDVDVRPVKPCAELYHYRNKMEYTFSNERWLTPEEFASAPVREPRLALGLHLPEKFDKILDLGECHLQSPGGEAVMLATVEHFRSRGCDAYSSRTHEGYLRHLVIREGKLTGQTMVNLVTTHDRPEEMEAYAAMLVEKFPGVTTVVNNITERKSMVALGEREVVYRGGGTITEMIGGYTYRVSANSFFQTNTVQARTLFETMAELAGFSPSDAVYDLYCGTGAIAIYISGFVDTVVGIEVSESAVLDARRNAAENGIANCHFVNAILPAGLDPQSEALAGQPRPNVVVVDPPRNGLHAKLIEKIVALSPEKIVYVSCNPATQARDAKLFAAGGYLPGPVQPVDMFPHTDHVETVTVLRRGAQRPA